MTSMKAEKMKRRTRFAALIRSLELTVPEVAEYHGASPAVISNMVHGRTRPDEDYMFYLERAFARIEAYILYPKVTEHPGAIFSKAIRRRQIEMEVVEEML